MNYIDPHQVGQEGFGQPYSGVGCGSVESQGFYQRDRRAWHAYLWRSGHAPLQGHTGFVRFLRALLNRHAELAHIATVPGFELREELDGGVRNVMDWLIPC